ncbi:MAG: hypothetical protein Q7T25_04645 [Sideroxyarcus sp.]|nr:hypothetical protein [Sideroxyarcus sp.]
MDPIRDIEHKEEQQHTTEPEQAIVAGWKLHDYIIRFRYPLVIVVVAEMVLLILTKQNSVVWILHLGLFAYLVMTTQGLTVRRAAMLGAFTGFFAGLGMAIFRLVFIRQIYYALNLIAEPALTAVLGGIVAATLFRFIRQRQESRAAKKNDKEKPDASAPESR